VFECFDKKFGLRAICGGGRYDGLMQLYGSKVQVPCVGFGFGDCVIKELLTELGKLPSTEPAVDFVVAPFDESMFAASLQVTKRLRAAGWAVNQMLDSRPGKKAFDYANRIGTRYVAYVAPDEWAVGNVRERDTCAFVRCAWLLYWLCDRDVRLTDPSSICGRQQSRCVLESA
jgi:histidyl-tRNA synthetase